MVEAVRAEILVDDAVAGYEVGGPPGWKPRRTMMASLGLRRFYGQ